jgi:predicted PurR-regulated permease PerM
MNDQPRTQRWYGHAPSPGFVQRVLVVVGIVALTYLAWQIRNVFLLAFAGVLVAMMINSLADPIGRWTQLSQKWSLLLACLAIALVLIGFFALIGIQAGNQASALLQRLPDAIATIERQFDISFPTPAEIEQNLQQRGAGASTGAFALSSQVLSWLASWSAALFQILTGFVLVVITGIFLSVDPETYRRGVVKLFPKSQHDRVDETLVVCGRSLRLWLIGHLVSMTLVGVLVGLGAWLIGLPGPLALGLFAGLAEFVPIIGPIIGAVPALIFAATQGLGAFIWTALLFLAVQQLESNVITPMVEKRAVSIPPALFLLSVVAFGLLFGVLGLILAAPLTVVAYVAAKKLYVRETLGEPTPVPGEKAG